ncbi:MAG: ABC transporter permease [Candidatus Cyclobacteriaceae bacterium M3_2C_046]
MLNHYFLITWRNILNNKLFSLINVSGLALGIACFLLIMSWVNYQFSYDKYHSQAEQIYRIKVKGNIGNTPILQTATPAPIAQALYDEFPEIKSVVRMYGGSELQLQVGDQVWLEKSLAADSTIMKIFDFNLLQGNSTRALNQPNTMIVSQSLASKIFPGQDPLDQLVHMVALGRDFKITGIFQDLPQNSHLEFDLVASMVSLEGVYDRTSWWNNSFTTYLLLHNQADAKGLEAKLPAFIDKYFFPKDDYSKWSAKGNRWEYYLEPLTSLHLFSELGGIYKPAGNARYVYILSVAALFILIIACINFINLTTARASARTKEVGVRKVNGAHRSGLIKQFLGESIFLSLFALLLGILLYTVSIDMLAHILGDFEAFSFSDPVNLLILLLFVGLIGLLSGFYPAFYLSSFQPMQVLKDKFRITGQSRFRNALVVFQFSLSIILLIATMLAYQQLSFLQNEKLGFDKERVLVLPNASALAGNLAPFMKSMADLHQVKSTAQSNFLLGQGYNNIGFGAEGMEGFTLNLMAGDEDLAKTLGLNILQGRFFSRDFPSDSTALVINQAAADLLEWENPVGQVLMDNSSPRTEFNIVGMMEDFHYESKRDQIKPMAFMRLDGSYNYQPNFILIKVAPGGLEQVLKAARASWQSLSNGLAFEYTFLDKEYARMYSNEQRSRQLFVLFSMLSLLIACMGLFGLVTYITEKKTKEIGIRKAIGATYWNISTMIAIQFIKGISLAFLLAAPIAYLIMNQWLQNFAYRIEVTPLAFLASAAVIFLVAILTVGYKTMKASLTNPIKALRYE